MNNLFATFSDCSIEKYVYPNACINQLITHNECKYLNMDWEFETHYKYPDYYGYKE